MKKYTINNKKYTSDEIKAFIYPVLDNEMKNSNRVTKVLEMLDTSFDSMLDIGCNTGRFLQLASQINTNATKFCGVDCLDSVIDICKDFIENDKIKFYYHDCETLKFEDSSFDVVTFFEVLEHVRNLDIFLEDAHRALRDNGCIYLSVPNATWWRNVLKDILINTSSYASLMEKWPKYTLDQRDHINNFNFIHLYRILNLNGFKIEQVKYHDQPNNIIFRLPYINKLSSTMILKLRKQHS